MRRAFTLIELIISIMIIALIVTYLYQSLDVLKRSNDQLLARDETRQQEIALKRLFLLDLMQSSELNITRSVDRDIDLVRFTSRNSLHNIAHPKVTYLVSRPERTLIRIEGLKYSLPLDRDSVYRVKFDTLLKDVTHFKLYKNQKKKRVLVTLKQKGRKLQVFELYTP